MIKIRCGSSRVQWRSFLQWQPHSWRRKFERDPEQTWVYPSHSTLERSRILAKSREPLLPVDRRGQRIEPGAAGEPPPRTSAWIAFCPFADSLGGPFRTLL